MKKLLVMFLMLIGLSACAEQQRIDVLPLFMSNAQNTNSYGFETASEIVAGDIIQNFLLGNKFNTTKLAAIKSLNENNFSVQQAAQKYAKTGLIDFEKLSTTADKTLLVIGYVEDNNFAKIDLWDALKLSSDFGLDFPFVWTTKVVLFDNKDGVALWQKTYTCPLTSREGKFIAPDYTRAVEQYEKVRSFSKYIIAKDVEENINLRLNPKEIDYASNVNPSTNTDEGIGLKFYKRGIPVKITQPAETFEQQLLKDDSFSL
ncbi:MAG: hypothetical protein NC390_03130 [Fusobacterium sp.]|nr:hypothetical protein [Fusobacterium sp.]